MSTTFRLMTVRLLRKIGLKQFRAQNGLRQPYICHLGDSFGENIFYHPTISLKEIVLMAAWCRQFERPVMYDVGGNFGYIASQLAQLIQQQRPLIYSFEPILKTYIKLKLTIDRLELGEYIFPICCALSDSCGLVQLSYSEWNSVQAQIAVDGPNPRVGNKMVWANALTLDLAVKSLEIKPHLVKVDVEGHESNVFRGAQDLFAHYDRPAVQFELNPLTMQEMGVDGHSLASHLKGYDFYYVGEIEGHKKAQFEFGQPVPDLTEIQTICNIFAVPTHDAAQQHWRNALATAEEIFVTLRAKTKS